MTNVRNFHSWKCTFKDATKELGISPAEEVDLLIKWLGPESKRSAISLKNANASDPTAGLASIWERLEERYGAVESVYHSVLTNLQSFPKLGARDSAKLYDLCDILGEIQALKNNPVYSTAFSYFDSSVGVTPTVSKLPFNLQEKCENVAIRYKQIQQFCISSTCIIYEFLEGASKDKE